MAIWSTWLYDGKPKCNLYTYGCGILTPNRNAYLIIHFNNNFKKFNTKTAPFIIIMLKHFMICTYDICGGK